MLAWSGGYFFAKVIDGMLARTGDKVFLFDSAVGDVMRFISTQLVSDHFC